MTVRKNIGSYQNPELFILDLIQRLRSPLLDHLMILSSKLGDAGIIWITLAVCFYMRDETRNIAIVMIAGLITESVLCNLVLKPLCKRTRPCDINPSVSLLIKHPADYSFPSGHTSASFCCVCVLYLCKCIFWKEALLLACLIAFSRLYLYVHYPSDIVAGVIIGCVVGEVVYKWCMLFLL